MDPLFSAYAGDFKLSITRALADQLAEALSELRPTPLTPEILRGLDAQPGVYELWLRGERVYVGKASVSLPARLTKHLRKLSGRIGITCEEVEFMCLYVDEDLEAAAPEKMLIKKYRKHDAIPWNTNGFGNNDPGRRRDNSLVKANHFDAHYPVNLDLAVKTTPAGTRTVAKFLGAAKKNLPFNLRFDGRDESKPQLAKARVEVPDRMLSAREVVTMALDSLPSGWQATALPGYVILYKEEREYDSALRFWRRVTDGVVIEQEGPGRLDTPGEIEEDPDSNAPDDDDE